MIPSSLEQCFSVVWLVHNKTSGSWASKVAWSGTDYRTAKSQYFAEQSRLTGSSDFDVVNVYLLNLNDCEMQSLTDDRVPEPIVPVTGT